MAEFDRPTIAARPGTAAVIDEGLRSYMLKVYNYMGIGLVVTGLVAYFTYTASFVEQGGNIVGVTELGNAALQQPAAVGRDARPAGLRAGAELRHQQAERAGHAGAVLGLRRRDGPVA